MSHNALVTGSVAGGETSEGFWNLCLIINVVAMVQFHCKGRRPYNFSDESHSLQMSVQASASHPPDAPEMPHR